MPVIGCIKADLCMSNQILILQHFQDLQYLHTSAPLQSQTLLTFRQTVSDFGHIFNFINSLTNSGRLTDAWQNMQILQTSNDSHQFAR